jgi:hypothetical protein
MNRINANYVVDLLTAHGYSVEVHTSYHMQIPHAGGKHNVWVNKDGEIKFMPTGWRSARIISTRTLLDELLRYNYRQTDEGAAKIIRAIENLSVEVEPLLTDKQTIISAGIFVDAGWKLGKARIAVIHKWVNGDMDVFVRNVACESSQEAEELGIQFALDQYPSPEYNDEIYTDNQFASTKFGERVKWIPRGGNQIADKLSHLRGK